MKTSQIRFTKRTYFNEHTHLYIVHFIFFVGFVAVAVIVVQPLTYAHTYAWIEALSVRAEAT